MSRASSLLTGLIGQSPSQATVIERRQRLARCFKIAILMMTGFTVAAITAGNEAGRYFSKRTATRARWLALRTIGVPPDHSEIEADRQLKRNREIPQTRRVFSQVYRECTPGMRDLLDALGMDPERILLRWGNYDLTLMLPSTLYRADSFRSYRLIPHTRSVWLKGIALPRGLLGALQAPDTPELRPLLEATGAYIVPGSLQTVNSWGCRGPEPDLTAPLRGLILGDSNMQGFFIGDEQTPPECLRRELEQSLKTRVSLLNTGHVGYSPEQYYYTLCEYIDRFRPHFVVLSFCGNDFGDGEWAEGAYWFERMYMVCRGRNLLCVTVPVPSELQVTGVRGEGRFPGQISDACQMNSLVYCNPIDALVEEHLRIVVEERRQGKVASHCRLYNGHLGDNHFSPTGAATWAKILGRRLTLLLERQSLIRNPPEIAQRSPGSRVEQGPGTAPTKME